MCRSQMRLGLCGLGLVVGSVVGVSLAGEGPPSKKLIATGWDMADTARLRANLSAMEARPFDGVVFHARGRDEKGKAVSLRWAHRKAAWDRTWFAPCAADLRAMHPKKLAHNFLVLNANPGDVDWFDDAGWASIAEHWQTAAWLARHGRGRGILFDPEPYAPPHAQFEYGAQAGRHDHTFAEYRAQARLRGRQVMKAVAGEFPDVTVFCYFLNSVCRTALGQAEPRRVLAGSRYGLLPAFLDGWLDAAPRTATFVDGCEGAYLYNSTAEYLEAYAAIKGPCQQLVSPENRAKYRAQVQVSFGVYLDAYWNPKDSEWGRWYVDGLGGKRVDRLRANVATALRLADEYVWIYGEKFRWWPTPNPRVRQQTWPEALDGCERVLAYVRHPVAYARAQLARPKGRQALKNLLRNGDFQATSVTGADGRMLTWAPSRPPVPWHAWQAAASKGTFTYDKATGRSAAGSARARGVQDGCFLQGVTVRPGERFAVRAYVKAQPADRVWVRVRWQTAESRWTCQGRDVVLFPSAGRGPWREALGVVEVPEGAGRLVVLLGVGGQSEDHSVWFDDVGVYRLE